MAPVSFWKGDLQLSLVNCAVFKWTQLCTVWSRAEDRDRILTARRASAC